MSAKSQAREIVQSWTGIRYDPAKYPASLQMYGSDFARLIDAIAAALAPRDSGRPEGDERDAWWRMAWNAAVAECARIADDRVAPMDLTMPADQVLLELRAIVLTAAINADRQDDQQPEHDIALAVMAWLDGKAPGHLNTYPAKASEIASAIRALATPEPTDASDRALARPVERHVHRGKLYALNGQFICDDCRPLARSRPDGDATPSASEGER